MDKFTDYITERFNRYLVMLDGEFVTVRALENRSLEFSSIHGITIVHRHEFDTLAYNQATGTHNFNTADASHTIKLFDDITAWNVYQIQGEMYDYD